MILLTLKRQFSHFRRNPRPPAHQAIVHPAENIRYRLIGEEDGKMEGKCTGVRDFVIA